MVLWYVSLYQPLTKNQITNTFVLKREEARLSLLFQIATNKNQNNEIWYITFGFQSPADAMKQTIETKLAVEREERLENEKKAKQEATTEAVEASPASLSQDTIKKKKKKKQKKKNTKPVPQLEFV